MKNNSDVFKILTMILSLLCAVLICLQIGHKSDPEIREGLKPCIQEISSKRKGLLECASMLESENNRLSAIVSNRPGKNR